MLDIKSITVSDLQKGKYAQVFPDLYLTQGLQDVNAWHDNQDIFKHILKAYEHLLLLLQNPPLKNRLTQKIDVHTREDLLKLMVIYHDVGKRYTILKNPDGSTQQPGHEQIASVLVLELADKLGLSDKEKNILSNLISLHGFVGDIATVYSKKHDEAVLKIFSKRAKGWDIELILFMLSDLEGSDLKRLDNKIYLDYRQTLETMLNFFL